MLIWFQDIIFCFLQFDFAHHLVRIYRSLYPHKVSSIVIRGTSSFFKIQKITQTHENNSKGKQKLGAHILQASSNLNN